MACTVHPPVSAEHCSVKLALVVLVNDLRQPVCPSLYFKQTPWSPNWPIERLDLGCPNRAFEAFPVMKYLLYTPSYHSLHHSRVHTNFCLFMPVYDYVYGTMDPKSDALHASSWEGGRMAGDAKPDVVRDCNSPEMFDLALGQVCCTYFEQWFLADLSSQGLNVYDIVLMWLLVLLTPATKCSCMAGIPCTWNRDALCVSLAFHGKVSLHICCLLLYLLCVRILLRSLLQLTLCTPYTDLVM